MLFDFIINRQNYTTVEVNLTINGASLEVQERNPVHPML